MTCKTKKYMWECPQCKSRYFSEPITMGVRNGVICKIHPICTKCFETCQRCGQPFNYGDTHECGAKRVKNNLVKHELPPDDPTFGITSTGSTSYVSATQSISAATNNGQDTHNHAFAFPITTTVSMTITKIGVNYNDTTASNIRVGLYTQSGAKPNTLLVESASTACSGSTGWQDVDLATPYFAAAGTYWLSVATSAFRQMYWAAGSRSYYVKVFGAFDATWSAISLEDANYMYNMRITYNQIEGYIKATKATLAETANVVNSMSMYCHVNTGSLRLGIYDNASPYALVWESGSTAAVNANWLTVNISAGTPNSISNLASGTYWLLWQYNNVGLVPSYTLGGANTGFYYQQTYGAFPATLANASVTLSTETWSIYVTYSLLSLEQLHYRFYNNNAADPTSALANEDTALTNINEYNQVMRLRISIKVTNSTLSGKTFKLQFKEGAGAYDDVGAQGSASKIRYFNGAATDQAVIANFKLTDSNVKEHYVESSPSAVMVDIAANSIGEWDFTIESNNASYNTTYSFRMYNVTDSSVCNTYTVTPALTTQLAPTITQIHYRWYSNDSADSPTSLEVEDTVTFSAADLDVFRLRLAASVATAELHGYTYKIQYQANGTGGAWTDVGAAGGAAILRYYNGLGTDQAVIGNLKLTGSDVKEHFVEASPSAVIATVVSGSQGEWDFCIQANSAVNDSIYYFRIVRNDGTALDTYTQYPALYVRTGLLQAGALPDLAAVFNVGQNGNSANYFNGWIDELRLTRGTALWATTFQPPTTTHGIAHFTQQTAVGKAFLKLPTHLPDWIRVTYNVQGAVPSFTFSTKLTTRKPR